MNVAIASAFLCGPLAIWLALSPGFGQPARRRGSFDTLSMGLVAAALVFAVAVAGVQLLGGGS